MVDRAYWVHLEKGQSKEGYFEEPARRKKISRGKKDLMICMYIMYTND